MMKKFNRGNGNSCRGFLIFCTLVTINAFVFFPANLQKGINYRLKYAVPMASLDDPKLSNKKESNNKRDSDITYEGAQEYQDLGGWEGQEGYGGFDWQLEQARRLLEGPGFAPLRMTLWQPIIQDGKQPRKPPGFFDSSKILLNNALQMMGLSEGIDGAPMVQGVNTFKGSPLKLLSRVLDGNLQELAGQPLFLLLHDYYKTYGPVYKLAFGPKSFIVVSDPVMVKHILKVSNQLHALFLHPIFLFLSFYSFPFFCSTILKIFQCIFSSQ